MVRGVKRGKKIKELESRGAKLPYSAKEWAKIEKLVTANGKTYKSIKEAKKHLQAL